MTMLFVADLHYALKQFDWLVANAADFDPIIIGGDLLDLSSALDVDVQIMVVEKYLGRIRQKARLLVSSGNHDGDSRSAADESVAPGSRVQGGWFSPMATVWVAGRAGDYLSVVGWSTSRAELARSSPVRARRVRGRWIWFITPPPGFRQFVGRAEIYRRRI
jgi:hypothetical protein